MSELLLSSLTSGLLWFPFVLALGCTYRFLKLIDVSVDGVAVVAGVACAFAWGASESYVLSVGVAALAGLAGGLVMGFLIHRLGIEPLLAGIVLSLAMHSLSVITVGESRALYGTVIAGSVRAHLLFVVALDLAVVFLVWWFYRSHLGTLARALGSNPQLNSPLAPGLVITAALGVSGLVVGMGAGIYAHTEGLARSGGGFDFLLTGLTSFLVMERLFQLVQRRLGADKALRARPWVAWLGSVPMLALVGSVLFQVLVYSILRWSPRPDLWKLLLALSLAASLARWRGLPGRNGRRKSASVSSRGERDLWVEGLSKSFVGFSERKLLQNVSFHAPAGLTTLSGPNGSGKTTLLKCISGLANVDAGEIHLEGKRIDQRPKHGRGLFVIDQKPYASLATDLSVYENLLSVREPALRPFGAASFARAKALLAELEESGALPFPELFDDEFLRRSAGALSGGEAQCVAAVLCLLSEAPLILADEPTANLDVRNQGRLIEFLSVISEARIVFAVSHDRDLISQAHQRLKLHEGTVS